MYEIGVVHRNIQRTDAVSLPRTQLVWPTVPAGHPDRPDR